MSKAVKISIGLILAIVVVVGGLVYFVTQKINPEEIKKLIVKGISDALPATSVQLDKVEYSIGTSVTIALKDFDLRLRDSKIKLFNVSDVEVKVPIWAIITGGGAIDVNVKEPNAYYIAINKNEYNWDKALPREDAGKDKEAKTKTEESKEFQIPDFVNNSRIDIKVSGLNAIYEPFNAKPSQIKVSKIVFKNINLKTTTAFEVSSSIRYALDPEKNFKTKLQVIGEVNIGKFLKEKSLTTSLLINLADTSMTGLDFQIPNVESKLKVDIKPDGVIDTESEVKAGSLMEAVINASLDGKTLVVSKLQMNTHLSKVPEILPAEIKEKMQMVDLAKTNLVVNGDATVNLEPLKLNPNINFEVNSPVGLKLQNSINVATTLKGILKGQQFNMKLVSELFSGSVTTDISTEINPLQLPEKLSNYPITKVDVVATNIKLSRDFLQNTLYGGPKKDSKEDETAQNAQTVQAPGEPVELPPVELTLEGKNIFIDKEELEFNSLIKAKNNNVSSDKFIVTYSKGRTNIAFDTLLVNTNTIKNKFSISLRNMNMAALNSLLPPYISKISGIYEGDINGDLNLLPLGMDYNIKAKVSATNGDLDDLDVKKLVATFFEGMKDKVPKDYEKVSNKFDKLVVHAQATPKEVDVNKFVIIGDKKSIEIDLKGQVSMKDKHSELKGEIMLDSTREQLKKEFNIEKWPVRFAGDGFIMKPDLGYTTGKLADIKLKVAGKKAKQEVKKNIEKEKKKAQKKLEKKAKELLKGIKL